MTGSISLYQLLWYFLIYSFLGWVGEVIYQAVSKGLVVNRGFLNGPVCPIYGVGSLGVLCLLGQYASWGGSKNLPLLFLLGTLLATGVELTGGWALDALFHTRWWDYSDKPFQFHGYICLEFSLIWGIAILFAAEELHPWIAMGLVAHIPPGPGAVILAVLYTGFGADVVLTAVMLTRLRQRLEEMEELQQAMHTVSDRLSEVIGTSTLYAAQKVGEGQVQAALGRAELMDTVKETREEWKNRVIENRAAYQAEMEQRRAELQARTEQLYSRMLRNRVLGVRRLFAAFPELRSKDHEEGMQRLRQRWDELRQSGKNRN